VVVENIVKQDEERNGEKEQGRVNFEKKALSKYKVLKWCFGVFLLLAVVYMSIICYCDTISGDEYFSAGFANNTKGFLFLTLSTIDEFGDNGWIDGEFLREYLSVQEGEGFSILNIHRNVRDDVHPPLYFMLLNVLSSFFIDEIPYFAGFLINIISGIIICSILYLIGKKIFSNPWLALAAPIVWMGSEGARTTIVYLRMYAPLCALCLICLYLHMVLFEEDKDSKWLYIALAVSTTIGTLTHYYYYIMLVVIGVVSVVRLLCKKEYRRFIIYALSHAGGWLVSYVAYPYVFEHLLFSERGTEVQENLVNMDADYYKDFFVEFMQTLNDYVFNSKFLIIVTVFGALGIYAVIMAWFPKHRGIIRENENVFRDNNAKINFLLIACYALVYFLILFKISYSAQWLYISPIFALLSFIAVGVFAWIIEKIGTKRYDIIILLASILIVLGSVYVRTGQALERYDARQTRYDAITAYSDTCDVLFFYTDWNNLYNNQMQELMEFEQIYSIDVKEMEDADYESILKKRKVQQDIVVYIPTQVADYEEKAASLAEKIGTDTAKIIVEDKFAIYYLAMKSGVCYEE